LEVAWVYYLDDDRSSIRWFPDGRGAHLFVGRDAPHPFPPGVAIYGMERGLPYPTDADPGVEPKPGTDDDDGDDGDDEGDPKPVLPAEFVGEILDELDRTLPRQLASVVRAARVVVIIGDREDPAGPPR
jgi:hypothetical protein